MKLMTFLPYFMEAYVLTLEALQGILSHSNY
jgi:hypothetical protein